MTEVARRDLLDGLETLGLSTGQTAFVHASLRSLGHVHGGAATVVESFLGALGEAGTLVMPMFHDFFWGGAQQVWDRQNTPSRMGAISECLRTWPENQRSAHAPHPVVAVGRHAEELAACRNRSDFAFDSPFQRLIELDAWIVLLGVDWRVCTMFHLLEERVEVEYRQWVELSGTVVDGGARRHESYPFLQRVSGVANDFGPMGAHLEGAGVVHEQRIGDARVRAVRARDLYDQTMRMLRRDPLFLVSADTRPTAAACLSCFGETVARTSTAPQQPLTPTHVLSRRLVRVLNITRRDPPARARVRSLHLPAADVEMDEIELLDGVNDRVPAALALPRDRSRPLPAVICLHGTSGTWHRPMDGGDFHNRQAARNCPGWAREWARRGVATMALTQLNTPPRRESWNWEGAKLFAPYGHTAMGRLVDDVIAAVDYLLARPEIDASRISVAGFSLGGIASFYSFAVDERLAAAVSFCGGVGSVQDVVRTGRADFHSMYYYINNLLSSGIDHPDLLPALAPRPLLICGASQDEGMPESGLQRFAAAAKQCYATAGVPEAFALFHEDGEHALSTAAFEYATDWLSRVGATSAHNPH